MIIYGLYRAMSYVAAALAVYCCFLHLYAEGAANWGYACFTHLMAVDCRRAALPAQGGER